ncbi:MAG: hypothetical protein IPL26_05710 [Leptospiraceae bacterium]|nr:hypothetical protein [Leptospiraceae bacterium]
MNKSKHIVINLSGKFNQNLGETVWKQVESTAHTTRAVLFDFSGVDNISQEGLVFLKKIIYHLREFGTEIAFSGIKNNSISILQENIDKSLINIFALREEAKTFLESRLDITEEEIKSVNMLPEVRSALVKEGVYYTYCPSCNAKLRLRAKGNYACPACKTKFFFNPVQEPMKYERISLE